MEVEPGVQTEVLVAEVAPAEDRHPAVDDDRLFLHALVHARQVGGHLADPSGQVTLGPRIEEPHLDVRMPVDQRQNVDAHLDRRRIAQQRVQVVDEQPDFRAAVGCVESPLHQQAADGVAEPDVVLHVNGAWRGIDQRQAPAQPVLVAVGQLESGDVGRAPGQ